MDENSILLKTKPLIRFLTVVSSVCFFVLEVKLLIDPREVKALEIGDFEYFVRVQLAATVLLLSIYKVFDWLGFVWYSNKYRKEIEKTLGWLYYKILFFILIMVIFLRYIF